MPHSHVLRPSLPASSLEPRDRLLGDILRRQAAQRGAETAFDTPSRSWTFSEANDAANRIAQGLLALGIGHGDRVACLTRHGAECTLLMIAASRIGAVCAALNWRLAPPEIAYVLSDSQARFLLTDLEFAPALRGGDFPALELVALSDGSTAERPRFDEWTAGFAPEDPARDGSPTDAALQLYSSGTTGLPKGVVMSSFNLMLACCAYARVYGIDSQTRMLNALPSFHIAGVENALTTLIEGGRTRFHPAFDPETTIRAIEQERITHAFLVPAMMLFVLQHPAAQHADFSSLRAVSYGGSPVAESLLAEAKARFGCGLLQVYGMTEATGPASWLLPEDHDPGGPRAHLLRSAGTPSPGVEIRIVDPGSGEDCAQDEVGEVWVRTPQNMIGYWRNPEATAEVFPEGRDESGGWLRTGDAGYHREGVIYIHDRIKDMIISGGENIYPAEVENALAAHPAIAEVAVIGVPDTRWGEAVKACVVLRPGAQPDAPSLLAWVRERLAHYKCPKSVDFVDALPRNPSGKVLKRVLREPYWQAQQRGVS
ncbi:MAG: long-chain-fatty-acid--CoA ligase [Burkholderiaceae bacterium]|nr:long-chain-fatty-acid--CoA ligase [Burkholderiaceae bacterium]